MAAANLNSFLRHLTGKMAAAALADRSDQQLVEQALAGRDEAVFRAIMRRHGGMVCRVCRRVLRHAEDVEDAFRATSLILARKRAAGGGGPHFLVRGALEKLTRPVEGQHFLARRVRGVGVEDLDPADLPEAALRRSSTWRWRRDFRRLRSGSRGSKMR